MFKIAITYLEAKTPTWVKVMIAFFVIGWNVPIKVRDMWYDSIDTRVHAVVTPQVEKINTRVDNVEAKAHETNAFVKAMALQALGTRKYEEVSLTAVDKTK